MATDPHKPSLLRAYLPMLLAAGLAFVGIVLFVSGILLGVAAGAVPYPDGPNAGQISTPEDRWMEDLSGPLIVLGVVLSLLGGLAEGLLLIRWLGNARQRVPRRRS